MFQATHQGRFELGSGKNFNRDFFDLAAAIAPALEDCLGSDGPSNVRLIRAAMQAALEALPPADSELQGMQRLLLKHACDADVVLDLHCDFDAAVHLYLLPQQWPQLRSLAARYRPARRLPSRILAAVLSMKPVPCPGCSWPDSFLRRRCRWPAWR